MSETRKSIPAEHQYQGQSNDEPPPDHVENSIENGREKVTFVSTVQSKMLGCGACIRRVRIEIVTFLFMFSYVMTQISSTSMIIDKVCLVHFRYPSNICNNLDNDTDIKHEVEKLATNYQLGHSLFQVVPAAILSCFIGPWSDQYGRKFPVIIALVGMTLDAMGSAVCAYFLETRAEYYFIPAIFTGIFGGPVSILAVIYSYASDVTPQLLQRTMKYAFIEMASGFAQPFGATAGGWIFKFLGYPAVFSFSIAGLCLSLIWVVFVLEETRGLDNDDPWSTKLQKLRSCESFKESCETICKERPHKGRKQVILLIISVCFLVITLFSTGDINYLYVHRKFGWSNTKYSTLTSIYSVIGIVVLIIIIPLMRHFRIKDPYLGLLGSISLLVKNIGVALSFKEGIYHIASLFGPLGGCATFAARSRISKVVSTEDLGKIFSFVSAAENLLPILTTILTSQLFTAFIKTFPGMPYLFLAFFLILPVGVFSWMACLPDMSYADIGHNQKLNDVQENA